MDGASFSDKIWSIMWESNLDYNPIQSFNVIEEAWRTNQGVWGCKKRERHILR